MLANGALFCVVNSLCQGWTPVSIGGPGQALHFIRRRGGKRNGGPEHHQQPSGLVWNRTKTKWQTGNRAIARAFLTTSEKTNRFPRNRAGNNTIETYSAVKGRCTNTFLPSSPSLLQVARLYPKFHAQRHVHVVMDGDGKDVFWYSAWRGSEGCIGTGLAGNQALGLVGPLGRGASGGCYLCYLLHLVRWWGRCGAR